MRVGLVLGAGGVSGVAYLAGALSVLELRRRVFGPAASPAVSTAEAVAASCAVPGVFAPVRIGDTRYVDGGVHSPTNADVLAGRDDLDAVVVVSPLTAPGGFPSVRWALCRTARRVLARELASLPSTVPVLVLDPPPSVGAHLALDPVDDARVVDVVREAFLAAPGWLHAGGGGEVVDVLRASARRSSRVTARRWPPAPPQEEVA